MQTLKILKDKVGRPRIIDWTWKGKLYKCMVNHLHRINLTYAYTICLQWIYSFPSPSFHFSIPLFHFLLSILKTGSGRPAPLPAHLQPARLTHRQDRAAARRPRRPARALLLFLQRGQAWVSHPRTGRQRLLQVTHVPRQGWGRGQTRSQHALAPTHFAPALHPESQPGTNTRLDSP